MGDYYRAREMVVKKFDTDGMNIPFEETGLFKLVNFHTGTLRVDKADIKGPAVLEPSRTVRYEAVCGFQKRKEMPKNK